MPCFCLTFAIPFQEAGFDKRSTTKKKKKKKKKSAGGCRQLLLRKQL